jgi:hypothetical protein
MVNGTSLIAIPGFNWLVLGLIVFGLYCYIKFNAVLLGFLGRCVKKISAFFEKYFGSGLRRTQKKFKRSAYLSKSSLKYRIYRYFDEMIVNLDLHKDGVNVTGLILFVLLVSIIAGIIMTLALNLGGLIVAAIPALFALITIIFRLTSLTRMEKKEEIILDAIDLLVSDIRGGVYNGIIRYQNNFHPSIRYAFIDYIENRERKGYSGRQAMLILNEELGYTFSDFAQKAIMYEERADDSMDDIFSAIIDSNRHRRNLRYTNNIAFNKLRTQFIVASTVILGYCLFTLFYEPFIRSFLLTNFFGKILMIVDILIFAGVLSYLTSIKAKAI